MTRTFALLCLCAAALVTAAHANPPPVVVPYYGATYGPAGGLSAADGKRVVELLESIDGRLKDLQERAPGAPAAVKKGPDLPSLAKAHCAACHTPRSADAKGGGFVLFADDTAAALKPLGGREKTRITEAVQSGTMPPDGRKKLTPAERPAFKW